MYEDFHYWQGAEEKTLCGKPLKFKAADRGMNLSTSDGRSVVVKGAPSWTATDGVPATGIESKVTCWKCKERLRSYRAAFPQAHDFQALGGRR